MAKRTTEKQIEERNNDLVTTLAESLNTEFKDLGTIAYFINGDTPTDVNEWISTGSSMLDLAISNRPHGGIPVGRIIEINGLESSGKSLVAAHILAETQKKDGIAVYIDLETALSRDFLEAIGIDVSKMIYIQVDTVEQIFSVMESIINKIRESNKNKLVTIVVDSLAAATTSGEKVSDYNKEGWATDKAIIVSKAFRKITRLIGKERISVVFTNQLRQKLNAMFGDPYTTSGGKGLPFHSSVRVRLKTLGQIKMKTQYGEEVVGIKVGATVIKNRVGPPFRTADFSIYFNKGIDDYENWLEILKSVGYVQKSGGFKMLNENGEEIKFKQSEWSALLINNESLRNFIYDKICNIKIMHYKSESDIGITSDSIDSTEPDDENVSGVDISNMSEVIDE